MDLDRSQTKPSECRISFKEEKHTCTNDRLGEGMGNDPSEPLAARHFTFIAPSVLDRVQAHQTMRPGFPVEL